MISAYISAVVRDRASDRGCTGGSEGGVNVGPPGEISGGFSFARLPVPGCSRRRLSAHELKKAAPANLLPENKLFRYLHTAANEPRRWVARLNRNAAALAAPGGTNVDLEILPGGRDSAYARPNRAECPPPA